MIVTRPVVRAALALLCSLPAWSVRPTAATPSASIQDVYLEPLPATGISLHPAPAKAGANAADANNGGLNQAPVLSSLAGSTLTVDFPAGATLRGLAVPRVGWKDWAVPSEISIEADGINLGRFALKAPRHSPATGKPQRPDFPPIVTADIIDFGQPRSVRQLRVTVEKTETTGNKHGILKVCGYTSAPVSIDLNPVGGVSSDSEGVELTLNLAPATSPAASPASSTASASRGGLHLTALVRQFRRTTSMRAPLPPLVPGENRVRVCWEEFVEIESPGIPPLAPISPQHFHTLLIGADSLDKNEGDITVTSWSFIKTPGQRRSATIPLPAWEQIPRRQFAANSEGWRPGIPSDGFGRFGWVQNSGLLVGSVAPGRFGATAIDGNGGKQTATWNFRFGKATVQNWTRTTADWVSVRHQTHHDLTAEMRNELEAKAPELLREERRFPPEIVTASVLAPGFLLDSMDRLIVIEPAPDKKTTGPVPASPRLLISGATGLRWLTPSAREPLPGAALSEGWIIVTWPGLDGIPLLLALQRKPVSIKTDGAALEITFGGPLGRIGVSYPSGYYEHGSGNAGATSTDETLAGRARQIAAILRAYPLSATQEFRTPADAPDTVEIRETIRHLEWTNDWEEPSRRIAPLPPLARFAADQGYPVKLPSSFLPGFDWPTKTGPYTAVEGNAVTWRLPVPDFGTRLYLRPSGPDPLSDHVAKTIPASTAFPHLVTTTPQSLQVDSLNMWFRRASSSLALPFLNDTQRHDFLAAWRHRVDDTLRPNAWFLRTEPFSRSAYPVSFGWIERNTGTLGDVNSGIGATLYGAWAYARSGGDWPFIEQKWPAIRGALEYYLVQHDWNNMQTGAREHSGSSAIDMDGIGYEGAVAFAAMSQELGYADEAALGRLLMARLSLSACMRWLGPAWTRPGLPREQWKSVGVGFSEFAGFDTFGARHGGPDHASGEIALSLSWVGQFPELYHAHLQGLGRDFWQWFEQDFVEKKMQDWRKDHPGNRNNHPANIAAHLYLRGLLGAPTSELLDELSRQGKWGLEPGTLVAQENAALYAMIAGRDFPVTLVSWGRAAVKEAGFDRVARRAHLEFSGTQPLTLTLAVTATPNAIRINGAPVPADAVLSVRGQIQLALPAGDSRVELQFP